MEFYYPSIDLEVVCGILIIVTLFLCFIGVIVHSFMAASATSSQPETKQKETLTNEGFAKQIGEAIVTIGAEDAMKCMCRMMCVLAASQAKGPVHIKFDCDFGTVEVTSSQPKMQS